MKTLLILTETNKDEPEFLILNGDKSKFNGVCVNSPNVDADLEREFCDLVWDDDGLRKHIWSNDVTIIENKNWDKVAICTFLS
jgi:hypothetical protein